MEINGKPSSEFVREFEEKRREKKKDLNLWWKNDEEDEIRREKPNIMVGVEKLVGISITLSKKYFYVLSKYKKLKNTNVENDLQRIVSSMWCGKWIEILDG